MLKCKICGTEFSAIKGKRYTGRDSGITGGLEQAFKGSQEGKLYDCFNCPECGCQVIAQERKKEC